jgi:hypothetical protein
MNHTFICQEGLWTGKGFYIDDDGHSIPCESETKTTHQTGTWLHESTMKLSLENNIFEIKNICEIVPFERDIDYTTWESKTADIGTLLGQFVIVHDSIFSLCTSRDSAFQGSEIFLKRDDTSYTNRGTLARRRKKVSSWTMELTKIV